MKKTVSKIAAALTASVAAVSMCQTFPASAAETVRLMGDLNGDMLVTAIDAQMTLELCAEAMVGNADSTANAENGIADINMNGEIDVTDAQSILLYYCQTLVGDQPLWADYREVSYHDGMDYTNLVGQDEDGNFIRVPNESPFELKGMYLEVGCAKGAPGETVTVPVYIAGADDLISCIMFVTPPEGLEPVSITSTLDDDFDLWHPTPEQEADCEEPYCPYVTYLPKGSFGFVTLDNIHLQDGYVLAYYSYTIPEDAQPGTVYPVCVNTAKTEFTAYHAYETDEPEPITGRESSVSYKDYQYTLLNGVIVVE